MWAFLRGVACGLVIIAICFPLSLLFAGLVERVLDGADDPPNMAPRGRYVRFLDWCYGKGRGEKKGD